VTEGEKPKTVIKCEAEKCPLQAEYKLLTVTRERHYCCETHWRELINQVKVATWQKI
jgi:hypothetical protein